jgi:ribose 5-phosphate isomerase A
MNRIDLYKKQAAEKATEYLQDGMIVGLGSGSTANFAIQRVAELLKNGQLNNIRAIPSSLSSEKKARQLGIPLTDFTQHTEIDITIDGADEVDPRLNLIKGGGGALLREKILVQCSKRVIIIVDETKLSPALGKKWPVPLEVLPFAWPAEEKYLRALGAGVTLRKGKKGKIYLTDQKNYILDFNMGVIKHPEEIANRLNQRAGILEHGLFLEMVSDVIVAGKKGITHLRRYEVL